MHGEGGTVCQLPRAMGAAGRFRGKVLAHASFSQFCKSCRATLPLLPDRRTQPASGPLFKVFQHTRCFAVAEVADPTP